MIPKANVIMLEKNQTLEQMIAIIEEYEYTRYPVFDLTKKTNEVIGFINTKEMLTDIAVGRTNDLKTFIHDIPRFKKSAAIKEVFLKMQQTRNHIEIVTEGSGKIVGLVTMEDILSEIVGEIQDEDDGDFVFTT